MPRPTQPRSHSRVAEQHNLHDGELDDPAKSALEHVVDIPEHHPDHPHRKPSSVPSSPRGISRQDSGYHSLAPSRRRSSPASASRHQNNHHQQHGHHRTRPPHRRAAKSAPVPYNRPRSSSQSTHSYFAYRPHPDDRNTYFAFPPFPDPAEVPLPRRDTGLSVRSDGYYLSDSASLCGDNDENMAPVLPFPPPPQTTHYWTSDRTRRLEYAAIDAATRGVRGWVLRHIVPDCFIPRDRRRLPFEDDRGSVVRYRLDLDDDEEEKDDKKRKGWPFRLRN